MNEQSRIRVEEVDGWHVVRDADIARRHRMSVGTIVSDASVEVRYFNGKRLGHVEESFVAWLSPGDSFVFAGHAVELFRLENMVALVRPARARASTVPRWQGGRSPLSSEVAESVRELLEAHLEGRAAEPEMRAVERLLRLQRLWSRIPRRHELLVEQWSCKLKLNQHRPEAHARMREAYAGGNEDERELAAWMQRLGMEGK